MELQDADSKKVRTAAKVAADAEFQKSAEQLSVELKSRTWASNASKRAREIKKKEM